MNHTLLVFPLKKELQYFLVALEKLAAPLVQTDEQTVFASELGLYCTVGGHGKVDFALATQRAIAQVPAITSVCCVGAAGSLSETVGPYDVVIAEKTIEHDYKVKFTSNAQAPEFSGSAEIIEKIKKSSRKDLSFQVHYGAIASGDEDIVDAQRAKELFEQTQAIAVAWEGAGGAKAARYSQLPFLEIRGITDAANMNALEDFQENLKRSMAHVAFIINDAFSS